MPATDEADARYGASKTLLKTGDFQAARADLITAIAAWPHDHRFYGLLAYLDGREKNYSGALDALISALELNDQEPGYWRDLWLCMERAKAVPDRQRLLRILARALRLGGANRKAAEREAAFQLMLKLTTFNSPAALAAWALQPHQDPRELTELDFLLTFLECASYLDMPLEDLLTALRANLLTAISAGPGASPPMLLELASAMAIHCFWHEYVFSETAEEAAIVESLQQSFSESSGRHPAAIAIVAAYRPLHHDATTLQFPQLFRNHTSARFLRLLRLQISNYLEEQALRTSIERLTPINDATSLAVRAQYEENPYPRWLDLPIGRGKPGRGSGQKILVAGCGTGQQAISVANKYPEAEIWAADLSLASLAYAARMAKVYGFSNIRFFQGDILELGAVSTRFDLITCGGVLHHLRDPQQGLAVLRDRLAPAGRLELAVYAERSRVAIKAGIALREQLRLTASVADIRKMREIISALPPDAPAKGVSLYPDFYFTSECRDLLFHVQEHAYTLAQLAVLFVQEKLKVETLQLPATGAALYHARFPDGDADTDLLGWSEIEAGHTNLFGPMYHLVLSRSDQGLDKYE